MGTLKDYLNEKDRFAASNGCEITEIKVGYAKAVMKVTNKHMNGGNVCQGGAFFTLADIAIAAAINSHGTLTFGIQNNISFLKSAIEGDILTAEAQEVVDHHRIPYVEARITNQNSELICIVTGIGYRKGKSMPVDGLM